MCCEAGDLDMMQYLHSQRARLNTADLDGRAVLHWLCMHGHGDALAWLHSVGVDLSKLYCSRVQVCHTFECCKDMPYVAHRVAVCLVSSSDRDTNLILTLMGFRWSGQ